MIDQFGIDDVTLVASTLSKNDKAFIVGGQALNIWAERYAPKCRLLDTYAPFTSKDIDYFGHVDVAEKVAASLKGKVFTPSFGDATSSTAIVRAEINGRTVIIDFISNVLGIPDRNLFKGIIDLDVQINTLHGLQTLSIPIMHPVDCAKSRVINILHPAIKRRNDVSMRQVRVSCLVLTEYIREMLSIGDRREAIFCLQEIFRYLKSDIFGKSAHIKVPVDFLDVIKSFADHESFPEIYRNKTIIPMILEIERLRNRRDVKIEIENINMLSYPVENEESSDNSSINFI